MRFEAPWRFADTEDPPPPEQELTPHAGPPELQHLLRRMREDDPGSTSGAEPPEPAPAEPEVEDRLLYTTSFLHLVLIPAILFGPGLPYPNNAWATASAGGLALVLAYLELQARQRLFAWIVFAVAIALLGSAMVLFSAGEIPSQP